jgi:hypothetical protein
MGRQGLINRSRRVVQSTEYKACTLFVGAANQFLYVPIVLCPEWLYIATTTCDIYFPVKKVIYIWVNQKQVVN